MCAALATIALAYEEPAPKSALPRGQLRARDLPSSASPKVLRFPRAHAVDQPRTTARMSEGETEAKRTRLWRDLGAIEVRWRDRWPAWAKEIAALRERVMAGEEPLSSYEQILRLICKLSIQEIDTLIRDLQAQRERGFDPQEEAKP